MGPSSHEHADGRARRLHARRVRPPGLTQPSGPFAEIVLASGERDPHVIGERPVVGHDGARHDAIRGIVACDAGRTGEGMTHFRRSMEICETIGAEKQFAWTLAFAGREQLLRGELDPAAETLERCIEITRRLAWTVFLPWPEALAGDVDRLRGDHERSLERFEHAFALGCQVGDPCWEGVSARGLGLLAAARGETDEALRILDDASRRCMRFPDGYVWVRYYALDALCEVATDAGAPSAPTWIEQLRDEAAHAGMLPFVVRAYLHQARLGDETATAAARELASQIDNPALLALTGAVASG